jgi:hypothetical protein
MRGTDHCAEPGAHVDQQAIVHRRQRDQRGEDESQLNDSHMATHRLRDLVDAERVRDEGQRASRVRATSTAVIAIQRAGLAQPIDLRLVIEERVDMHLNQGGTRWKVGNTHR